MPSDFETAIQQFEAGRHAAAADTCRAILTASPGDLSASNMLGVVAAAQGNFAEAAKCFQTCADAAPGDPGVAKNLAQALLETGKHDEAVVQFQRAEKLAGTERKNLTVLQNTVIDPVKAARGEPYVVELNNVLLETSYWAIAHDRNLYIRETSNLNPRNSPWIKGRVSQDLSFAVMDVPPAAQEIETPCILLGGDENYAHWVLRYLMRLALIEDRDDLAQLPLLTIDSLKPYQRDSLEWLGYDQSRLVTIPRHTAVKCGALTVPTCLRTDTGFLEIGIRWLRAKFLKVKPTTPPKRLFISRGDAPSRYLSNEEQVLEALAPFELEVVRLSEHSFEEQIGLFSNAEIVVGPHGAGLVNMVFAPEACPLIELVSDPIAHMNEIRLVGDVLGQPTSIVPSVSYEIDPGATQPMVQHNFQTDPTAVRTAVENALATISAN